MKEFDPSFVAILSMKSENYRADPATNTLNPEAVHITLLSHQKIKSNILYFSKINIIKN